MVQVPAASRCIFAVISFLWEEVEMKHEITKQKGGCHDQTLVVIPTHHHYYHHHLYMHPITAPRKPVKEKGSEETPPQSKTFLAFPTSNGGCLTEGIVAF